VLIFSFGSKLYRLEVPKTYYFDEVYYAFTAQEMAKGNKHAWQNTGYPPEDFAYEWTHPPLGKELSALGIKIFGDNAFGWRFFQAFFGGLGALLIYLVAKNLFLSKGVGLIAAVLYSLDSFLFVLSRITMVDIFMVDFLLLASLFVIKYARSRKKRDYSRAPRCRLNGAVYTYGYFLPESLFFLSITMKSANRIQKTAHTLNRLQI